MIGVGDIIGVDIGVDIGGDIGVGADIAGDGNEIGPGANPASVWP